MPGTSLIPTYMSCLGSGDAAKADRAESILSEGGAISVQVLNEVTECLDRDCHGVNFAYMPDRL